MTIGVFVTGSRVRPPTVMRMKFSRFMPAPAPSSAIATHILKQRCTEVNGEAGEVGSVRHQAVDDVVELIQVSALLDHAAMRRVAIHLTVAESPRHAVLGVQPHDLLGALENLLEHP